MTLKIYGVLRSRASRNVWLLNELDVLFEHIPVIQAYRLANPNAAGAALNTASPEFHNVNPNGLIPSMVDGDLVLHESMAINLYLAKKYGGSDAAKTLGPKNLAEDGQMTMWTLWAMTECETHTLQILYNRIAKPEAERDHALATASVAAVERPFSVLETHLKEQNGFIVGGRFTVADINLAEVIRYAQPATELFIQRPYLSAWMNACQARPAFKAMMTARNTEPA